MSGELIFLVDDEAHITDLARMYLEREGYRIAAEVNGLKALEWIRSQKPDLVVLDLMLPGMDGFEICRTLRVEKNQTPVILLTARDEDVDKILGLEFGADDYMTKPFNPRELSARIKAILRRVPARESQYLNSTGSLLLGKLNLNDSTREVKVNDLPVDLRRHEFELLRLFMNNPGRVFTREQLLQQVWGFDFAGETRTVDVHISKLRDKLSAAGVKIETVVGVGYKLVK